MHTKAKDCSLVFLSFSSLRGHGHDWLGYNAAIKRASVRPPIRTPLLSLFYNPMSSVSVLGSTSYHLCTCIKLKIYFREASLKKHDLRNSGGTKNRRIVEMVISHKLYIVKSSQLIIVWKNLSRTRCNGNFDCCLCAGKPSISMQCTLYWLHQWCAASKKNYFFATILLCSSTLHCLLAKINW